MNISDKNHPHHAVWREHVQSVLDGEPKVVQVKVECCEWEDLSFCYAGVVDALWRETNQYRIKPRTITRTITYPEPMKVAPKVGDVFWVVNLFSDVTASQSVWDGGKYDRLWLSRGMCFATEADAKAAAQAIFGIES